MVFQFSFVILSYFKQFFTILIILLYCMFMVYSHSYRYLLIITFSWYLRNYLILYFSEYMIHQNVTKFHNFLSIKYIACFSFSLETRIWKSQVKNIMYITDVPDTRTNSNQKYICKAHFRISCSSLSMFSSFCFPSIWIFSECITNQNVRNFKINR